jgi:diguanylate cyclase (GGDEF)-like protein/PAS domain S-box-containing protein
MATTPARPISADTFHRLVAEGTADLQTVSTVDGVYRFVSPASLSLYGWEPDELVGEHQDAFVHPDDAGLVEAARQNAPSGPAGRVTSVWRFRCADGAYRWTESVSILAPGPDEALVVSALRDVGDRRQSELELRRRATTDPLTGVANRTVFMDRLQRALLRRARREDLIAVLFLDLDRFKLINDSVGHLMGDALLLQLAERLLGFLRPEDTLARLGGDEFAILVEDLSEAGAAVRLGARIVEAGRVPFQIGHEQFVCTTSVGISVTSDPNQSAEGLLQEADLALYRAKDRGRDRAEVFDEDLRTRAVGRLGIERMLRRAIDESRLRLEYQPIVDIGSGATVAAEALVRVWDPGRLGLVRAETFIGVAEETGLLSVIDEWVLQEAIQQVAAWHGRLDGTAFADVAVNVTARHLATAGFAQQVVDDLTARGLPTSALQIEVTERALMESSNSGLAALRQLRDAGVTVGLDDFGTGYSSLSHLRLFPLDFVKIDRSFIKDLAGDTTERAIVASIIDLCHALGISVVAEGVETQLQLAHLFDLGCDRAQGFRFAPPGPAVAIERLLRSPT